MPGPLDGARAAFADRIPAEAAALAGFTWSPEGDGGSFSGAFLQRPVRVSHPGFSAEWTDRAEPLPDFLTALIVYHLATADGAPVRHEWLSFADLPDGGYYVSAWRGYSADTLARHFGNRIADFVTAARRLGATPAELPGDAAFRFEALPRVPIGIIVRAGDEEFPASADILFDASAPHQLPTDCLAIASKVVVSALIAADPGSSA